MYLTLFILCINIYIYIFVQFFLENRFYLDRKKTQKLEKLKILNFFSILKRFTNMLKYIFINFRKENILWTQASAKGISDNGVLFFGLVGDTSLACWNENRLLDRRNIVSRIFFHIFSEIQIHFSSNEKLLYIN